MLQAEESRVIVRVAPWPSEPGLYGTVGRLPPRDPEAGAVTTTTAPVTSTSGDHPPSPTEVTPAVLRKWHGAVVAGAPSEHRIDTDGHLFDRPPGHRRDDRRREQTGQEAIESHCGEGDEHAEHWKEIAQAGAAAAGEMLGDGQRDDRHGDEADGDRPPARAAQGRTSATTRPTMATRPTMLAKRGHAHDSGAVEAIRWNRCTTADLA